MALPICVGSGEIVKRKWFSIFKLLPFAIIEFTTIASSLFVPLPVISTNQPTNAGPGDESHDGQVRRGAAIRYIVCGSR